MKHRNKHVRGDRMGEGTDEVDGAKTTRISLSFPLSAGLPGFSAQKRCSSSHPPSSSDVCNRDGSNGTGWIEEPFRDKQLSKTASKTERLPCSSSSFPVDLASPVSKNCKSSLSFSVDGSGSRYPTSPLQHSNKTDYSKETAGVSLNNGYKEHSTTETAHILFNLSARAYQDQGMKDPESSKGKKRKANSLHVELSLPLPSINPHSSSSTPPPSPSPVSLTSSPLTLPSSSFHDSFRAVPKPELLCGVCHRLFSTASSLTVHMRLHRGGRVLSCRHCGKAFIHNKRLQSHEATCRQGLPAFPVQPKEEPLEGGKVEGEIADEAAGPEQLGQGTRPGRPIKKARDLNGQHTETLTCGDALEEEDHFVKVVDGHIIYFCSVCERSYMTLSSLKRHSNVHSWRRKYPCHYCDKVFALAEYRTKHEVWHTGERRYQCIFCWEAFPTYYNLKTHQKAFHGINPGLISSEKTANGGYKQKVNALKLYRLLPMRSLKRPYKTYTQPMADGLLTSGSPGSLPVSLDASLPSPLDTKKLESFLKDLQTPDIKSEPEGFPIRVGVEQGENLAASLTDMAVETRKTEGSDLRLSGSSNGKGKTTECPESAVSSVITFAHSKPSVIMHSTAVSSSVIVHKNKTSSGERKRNPENHSIAKTVQKHIKEHSQRQHTDTYREWDAASLDPQVAQIRHSTEKLHKGRRAHNKTESSKTLPIAMGSEVKGSGPLCQITVRIGEEAIVKRSISETDLMRDKSPTRSKAKKTNFSQDDQREQRHTHHHQRKHRNLSQEGKEGEPKWKKSKLKSKVRKYFFRQEVREDRNDHDVEDNLWRPYYTYKPKRKALHMQGTKAWKRKIHFKHSLRPIRRTERFMKNLNKVDGQDADEEQRQKIKKEQKQVSKPQKGRVKETPHLLPVPSRTEHKEKEMETHGKSDLALPSTIPHTTLNPQHTTSSIIKQQWSENQASECGTCGRWFSSPRKRDKHELTHLFEFVCMLCRAPFPSQSKLEEHQRTQHPKNKPLSGPTVLMSSSRKEVEMKDYENQLEGQSIDKGSPVRLGRRPLIRYTCSKCDKVCKTSAALNCHIKRHELGNLTEVEDTQKKQDTSSLKPSAADPAASKNLDTNSEQVQSVSVIHYSKPDCQISDDQPPEKMEEHQRISNCESSKLASNEKVHSPLCAQFPQVMHNPALERLKVISQNSPSVLVMNSSECIDYRTPEKRNLDTLDQQKRSPVQSNRQMQIYQRLTDPQIGKETTPSEPISLKTVRGGVLTQGVGTLTHREGDIIPNEDFSDIQDAQDLRIFSQSSSQAQDLSMSTILAKKRELDQKITHPSNISKEQSCNEVSLLVPKEEPLSPIPSPTCSVIQTTPKRPSQRYSKSPCHSPGPLDLQLRPHLEECQSHRGRHNTEIQDSMLLANSAGGVPSLSHALLHPQVPTEEPKSKNDTSVIPTEHHRGSGYPVQELTLPLIIPGGYCSGKKQEEQILMSYPTGPLPFPPLGKIVPHSDSTKLPFYPDPYHLLYGPQLLPYPYNLAALPMALNMMASGDKEPLPFLPFFNYAAAAAPLTGTVPHPLMVNPSLYSTGGSSSTKQDSP